MMYSDDMVNTLITGTIGISLIILLILLVWAIFYTVCLWKLFKKAGKNGWEALIPFYRTYVLIEIAGLNWWYFLIAISGTILSIVGIENLKLLTNIAGMVVNFFIFYNLAKKMNKKPVGIAIAGILLSDVMIAIMALSKKFEYNSSIIVSPNGPFEDNKQTN